MAYVGKPDFGYAKDLSTFPEGGLILDNSHFPISALGPSPTESSVGSSCYRTDTHTHTHAHTHSLPSITSQDTGKASETGKASVNGHEAQERTLQEQGRRKESWKEGKDHGRELSLALGAGKTLCGSQGWRPSEARR